MKIQTDRDNWGHLMIYFGDEHTLYLRIYRKCPECHGRSYPWYEFPEECWVCHDDLEMFVWSAWIWRVRLAWYDLRNRIGFWWYERTHKDF